MMSVNTIRSAATRGTNIRTRAGRILAMAIVCAMVVLLERAESTEPLPASAEKSGYELLSMLGARVTVETAKSFGCDALHIGTKILAKLPDGSIAAANIAALFNRPIRTIPFLAAALVFGAIIGGRTWNVGWVRRALFVALGLVSSVFLVPVFSGVAFGTLLAFRPAWLTEVAAWQCAVFVAGVVTVGGWWISRLVVVDVPDGADAGRPVGDPRASEPGSLVKPPAFFDEPSRDRRSSPPLLWAAAAATVMHLCQMLLKSLGLDPNRSTLAAASLLVPTAGCAALLLWGLLRRSRAAKWAWAPLLCAAPWGGGGLTGAALFMIAVLATQDEWFNWTAGAPLTEPAWQRVRSRMSRPLAEAAWLMIGLACVGLVTFVSRP